MLDEIKRAFDMCETITPDMGLTIENGTLTKFDPDKYREHFRIWDTAIILPPSVKKINCTLFNSPDDLDGTGEVKGRALCPICRC